MEKSIYYGLPVHFKAVSIFPEHGSFVPAIYIKHATNSFWVGNEGQAILQEFDGQHAYLQLLDTDTRGSLSLPLAVTRRDLHMLYLLAAEEPVSLSDNTALDHITLMPKQACFLYLPQGNYQLRLGTSRSQLFAIAFRATLFRNENDQAFDFIKPLVQAYRQQVVTPLVSSSYRIDKRSEHLITRLCRALHPRRLGNDQYILSKVIDLIQFAHEAILAEHGAQHHEERLANEAYALLQHYVSEEGQQVRIAQLAKDLGLSSRHIQNLFKTHYGHSGQKLKEQMVLKKCKALLSDGYSIKACAYTCGYNSIEAFHHFFKKHMQENPSSYRARKLGKPY